MAIKWDKLTVKSQEAIQGAASHAAENGNPEVLPLHLMAALLEDKDGVVTPVLEKVGVGVQQLLAAVNQVSSMPTDGAAGGGITRIGETFSQALNRQMVAKGSAAADERRTRRVTAVPLGRSWMRQRRFI